MELQWMTRVANGLTREGSFHGHLLVKSPHWNGKSRSDCEPALRRSESSCCDGSDDKKRSDDEQIDDTGLTTLFAKIKTQPFQLQRLSWLQIDPPGADRLFPEQIEWLCCKFGLCVRRGGVRRWEIWWLLGVWMGCGGVGFSKHALVVFWVAGLVVTMQWRCRRRQVALLQVGVVLEVLSPTNVDGWLRCSGGVDSDNFGAAMAVTEGARLVVGEGGNQG
ncbi:hypothetical protein E2542_SST00864 [Spatholobus suberectus]|nr:hypothetical protein E2542_SST00864 [Spatholobus suberectus]